MIKSSEKKPAKEKVEWRLGVKIDKKQWKKPAKAKVEWRLGVKKR